MSELIHQSARAVVKVAGYVADFLTDPMAFRGQQLRGGGAVAEFEALLAERCGFPYCVATCNATVALMGLGLVLQVRDETVLFPRGHWEGSVAAFRVLGAKIERYDSGEGRLCLSQVPEGTLLVVGGGVHEGDRIEGSDGDLRCVVIEDSSRLPGVSVPSDSISNADLQVLSFGPGKPLSLGEGGAVLFREEALRNRFLAATQHPERVAAELGLSAEVPGFCINGRIHPLSALIGAEILKSVESANRISLCQVG